MYGVVLIFVSTQALLIFSFITQVCFALSLVKLIPACFINFYDVQSWSIYIFVLLSVNVQFWDTVGQATVKISLNYTISSNVIVRIWSMSEEQTRW